MTGEPGPSEELRQAPELTQVKPEWPGPKPTTPVTVSSGYNSPPTGTPEEDRGLKKEGEELKEAAFKITIDKEQLASIETPESRGGESYEDDEENTTQSGLQEVLERFKRLPEKLQFELGVTLIVGENGSGKSTLAKALYLVARYQDALRFFENKEHAYESVFNPGYSLPYERTWLKQAGLAPQVAKVVRVDSFQSGKRIGGDNGYKDFPEIIGNQLRNEQDYVIESQIRGEILDSLGLPNQSHRQTVDRLVLDELKREKPWNPKPTICFFDEPETGMSPKRHKQLEQELLDCMTEGSIAIVPTNSVVLFESDLPRIDLDYPERGIHRPSDYPLDRA